jgi:hypothetical protein
MEVQELRNRYDGILLSLLEETRFPSGDMLNRIERSISEDRLPEYLQELLVRVAQEQFPSVQMMERINHLLSRLSTKQSGT